MEVYKREFVKFVDSLISTCFRTARHLSSLSQKTETIRCRFCPQGASSLVEEKDLSELLSGKGGHSLQREVHIVREGELVAGKRPGYVLGSAMRR